MNHKEQLENELSAMRQDMDALYELWQSCLTGGIDGNGDILVSEVDGIKMSVLLGV